jgi:ataxin-3
MINTDVITQEDLVNKKGFICNSSDHWFALRNIDKKWYNLNSTNRRMPEIISDFYLSAFLEGVKDSGYQIFSVEGHYPESSEDRFEYYNKNQMWFEKRRIQKYHDKCMKRKNFKPNISGAGADTQL